MLSHFQVLPLGLLSISTLSSSRISRYALSSLAKSKREKLKCPQLAATSSKSASNSIGLDLLKSFSLYKIAKAFSLAFVYRCIASARLDLNWALTAIWYSGAGPYGSSSKICFKVTASDFYSRINRELILL